VLVWSVLSRAWKKEQWQHPKHGDGQSVSEKPIQPKEIGRLRACLLQGQARKGGGTSLVG
jgi:hypothetical protein